MSQLLTILAERLAGVRERIAAACQLAGRDPASVTLIAVTKTIGAEVVRLLPGLGLLDLGENRPQMLWEKAALVPDVRWHMIGHLQRNKIEKTVPLLARMHTVDSMRLLEALDAYGAKRGAILPVLLEVNCSREAAKGGFDPVEVPGLAARLGTLTGVRVDGLMTMAAYHDDATMSRPAFAELRTLRDQLATLTGLPLPHLSMGMTNDFEVAIQEGATFVRLGSILFEGLDDMSDTV